MHDLIRNRYSKWIIISILGVLSVFYFLFDPSESNFMPQCLFYNLSGYKCAGCGTQRMLHALLHGDILRAFRENALVFCSIPILIFMVWMEINRKKYPALYAGVHSRSVIIVAGLILLSWTLFRNLTGF